MSDFIPPSRYFPPASKAETDGLLAVGGVVTPDMILDALVHGIFPWPAKFGDYNPAEDPDDAANEEEYQKLINDPGPDVRKVRWNGCDYSSLKSLKDLGEALCWWSPDPRGIFELENIHIPSRLQRKMRSSKFQVTFDRAFPEVMLGCALAGERQTEGSWITKEFFRGYCKLFEIGLAHSVECWTVDKETQTRRLVGGVYGVAVNGFFAGESMFSVETDASKVALFTLLNYLKNRQFRLFDLQIVNSHTQSLGATEIPREEYLKRLKEALTTPVAFQES